jgi:hypothetical protein
MVMEQAEVTARVTYRQASEQQHGPVPCSECDVMLSVGAAISVVATYPGGQEDHVWLCAKCAKKENV